VMGPIPSQDYSREESRARLAEKFRHQALHGFSKWAVTEAASGTVIGECGVHYLEGGPDIELGYKLARTHWGHASRQKPPKHAYTGPWPNGLNGSWPSSTPPTHAQPGSLTRSAWCASAPFPDSITRGTSTQRSAANPQRTSRQHGRPGAKPGQPPGPPRRAAPADGTPHRRTIFRYAVTDLAAKHYQRAERRVGARSP
jgi:hypothetical protein